MAFGGFEGGRRGAPMADINVIPLVDIMLVLLVIFIVTAPLLTNSVKIDLPKATSAVDNSREPAVQFAIDGAGQIGVVDPRDRLGSRDRIVAGSAPDEDQPCSRARRRVDGRSGQFDGVDTGRLGEVVVGDGGHTAQ